MSDLALAPDYVLEETQKYSTLVSQFENGTEQRRAKWGTGQKVWALQYNNRSAADLGTIKTLFGQKLGALTAFTWTNPNDSTEYTVRFVEDSLTYSLVAYQVYNFSFQLQEVK